MKDIERGEGTKWQKQSLNKISKFQKIASSLALSASIHQPNSEELWIEYQSNQMIRFDWLECDRRTLRSQICYMFRN